jgi:osmotically-inducible protein OsmY
MRFPGLVAVIALALAVVSPASVSRLSAAAMPDSDDALAREVQRELSRVRDLRRLTVSVSGSEVTLSGQADSIWLKEEAIRRAGSVAGVETVVGAIEIPPARSDARLAEQVGQAIGRHPQLGVFDYVSGGVQNGVVTLVGSVTPTGRKANDVADAVARVRGVQAVRNHIVTLPPGREDDRIRAELASRLASNIHLQPLAIGRPPFNIVVHNSVVSLHGVVPGEIEYRQFEAIARETSGVLRVHNHLERASERR